MCGIYGLIFHRRGLTKKELKRATTFFKVLAVAAADRGVDATGLARIQRNGEFTIVKEAEPVYDMIRRTEWLEQVRAMGEEETFALIGHTRKKTHGPNIQVNAHSFAFEDKTYGSLVGVHNGVIQNHMRFGPTPSYQVDSANVLWGLANVSASEWGGIFKELTGSFAFAVARQGNLYITRNEGSPCVGAYLPHLHASVFASLPSFIASAAAMSGLRLMQLERFQEGLLYRFGQKRSIPFASRYLPLKPEVQETAAAADDEDVPVTTRTTEDGTTITIFKSGKERWEGPKGTSVFFNRAAYEKSAQDAATKARRLLPRHSVAGSGRVGVCKKCHMVRSVLDMSPHTFICNTCQGTAQQQYSFDHPYMGD